MRCLTKTETMVSLLHFGRSCKERARPKDCELSELACVLVLDGREAVFNGWYSGRMGREHFCMQAVWV